MQPQRLGDGAIRVVRQVRADLDAHAAIDAVRALPNGTQPVARHLDVLHRQPVEDGFGLEAFRHQSPQRLVVVVALGDGQLEDGRIGSDAHDAGVADKGIEFTRNEGAAADEVEPDTLAE